MYVCICNRVTDSTIKKAIDKGCNTLEEVTLSTSAGNCCGSCVPMIEEMIEQRVTANPQIQEIGGSGVLSLESINTHRKANKDIIPKPSYKKRIK